MAWRAVTDNPWDLIQQHVPKGRRSRTGGRPALDDRQCVEGLLWLLWTGAPWSALPARYGAKSAVHRRLKAWAASAVLLNLWRAGLNQRSDRQNVRWEACCIDGMFRRAKTGGRWSGRRPAARAHSFMVLAAGAGPPRGGHLEKASPSAVTLWEATRAHVSVTTGQRTRGTPQRLRGDSGSDSHPVRALLVKRGREPIIPARSHNTVATHQDGRTRRRDKRRWIRERRNCWWPNFRTLAVR